jgi:hypothetical protein
MIPFRRRHPLSQIYMVLVLMCLLTMLLDFILWGMGYLIPQFKGQAFSLSTSVMALSHILLVLLSLLGLAARRQLLQSIPAESRPSKSLYVGLYLFLLYVGVSGFMQDIGWFRP